MVHCNTTLFQAVQEFSDLCKNLPTEAVESALPFWPRLYNKLAMVSQYLLLGLSLCSQSIFKENRYIDELHGISTQIDGWMDG